MCGPGDCSWMFNGGMLQGGLWMILVWGIPLLLAFALLKYLFAKADNNNHPGRQQIPPSGSPPINNRS